MNDLPARQLIGLALGAVLLVSAAFVHFGARTPSRRVTAVSRVGLGLTVAGTGDREGEPVWRVVSAVGLLVTLGCLVAWWRLGRRADRAAGQ